MGINHVTLQYAEDVCKRFDFDQIVDIYIEDFNQNITLDGVSYTSEHIRLELCLDDNNKWMELVNDLENLYVRTMCGDDEFVFENLQLRDHYINDNQKELTLYFKSR